MTLLKAALTIPALVSGLWLVNGKDADSERGAKREPISTIFEAPAQEASAAEVSLPLTQTSIEEVNEAVVARRMRIERILLTLDQVAEVAMQMGPVETAWLEPVLIDLAEQTANLISEEAILSSDTDSELNRIEGTVDDLVTAIDRTVEPEMSL